jgi:hypothetical protein
VVDPVHFLIGGMAGWGGLPAEGAIYLVNAVEQNDGETPVRRHIKWDIRAA